MEIDKEKDIKEDIKSEEIVSQPSEIIQERTQGQKLGGFKREFKPRRDFKKGNFRKDPNERTDLIMHLVSLRAVSKTRAGGRQRSFSVLMIAGNEKGLIGCGTGKSADIIEAIKKAERKAKNNLIRVVLKGSTIGHNVRSYSCGTQVIIKQAAEGTGLKAGGVARKILSLAGIKDISCKCIGNSMSNHNVIYAILDALGQTMKLTELSASLGKPVKEILARVKRG